jgi:hypothetical protein
MIDTADKSMEINPRKLLWTKIIGKKFQAKENQRISGLFERRMRTVGLGIPPSFD